MWKLGLRPRNSQKRNILTELPLQCMYKYVQCTSDTEVPPRREGMKVAEDGCKLHNRGCKSEGCRMKVAGVMVAEV